MGPITLGRSLLGTLRLGIQMYTVDHSRSKESCIPQRQEKWLMACSLSPLVGIHWCPGGSPWLRQEPPWASQWRRRRRRWRGRRGAIGPCPKAAKMTSIATVAAGQQFLRLGLWKGVGLVMDLGWKKALRMTDIFRQGALTLAEAMQFSRIKTITSCAKSIGCSFFNSGHTRHGWLLIYYIYFYMFTHFHWSHTTSLLAMWIYHDLWLYLWYIIIFIIYDFFLATC